jgi:hypothetical protein
MKNVAEGIIKGVRMHWKKREYYGNIEKKEKRNIVCCNK